jgi:hypothetical protein
MSRSIFALELCARLDAQGELQRQLLSALPVASGSLSPGQKWQSYYRATQLLLYNLHAAERGCWDYFDDDERAETDFAMWKNGMTTAEGARPSARAVSPLEPRYLTFTMALKLVRDSPSDLALRKVCEVPQAALWQRATFARLLQHFGSISFASVQADVAYLIPRDLEWALTLEDLAEQKFHYLRPLV